MAKNKGSGKQFEFSPQSFTVSFDLYPLVAMIRENALKVAQDLSSHLDWSDIHMSDESWEFRRRQPRQGQPGGAILVVVKDEEVKIEHRYPSAGLERFEILVDQVIDAVGRVAQPQILLGTSTSLEYIVNVGGDARTAILGALQMPGEDQADKLSVLDRPCQFVGLRLGFPPYRLRQDKEEVGGEAEEHEGLIESVGGGEQANSGQEEPGKKVTGADWQATLTLQSMPDDPRMLSVDVDGRWMAPVQWTQKVHEEVRDRLRIVDDFLKTKVSEFLEHFRSDQ